MLSLGSVEGQGADMDQLGASELERMNFLVVLVADLDFKQIFVSGDIERVRELLVENLKNLVNFSHDELLRFSL
jgi:hypothetical protein